MRKSALAVVFVLCLSVMCAQCFIGSEQVGGQSIPFAIIGHVYDADGQTLLAGANVNITNLATGEYVETMADDGSYMADNSQFPSGIADGAEIRVHAYLEDRYGENQTSANTDNPFSQCDVYTLSDKPRIDHMPPVLVNEESQTDFSAIMVDDIGIVGAELRIFCSDGENQSTYGMEQDGQDARVWAKRVHIDFLFWPAFNYTITATDGRYNVSSGPHMVWVRDSQPPIIDVNLHDQKENEDYYVYAWDDHELAGGNVTYSGNSIPFNLNSTLLGSPHAVVPGQDLQMPNFTFTVSAWDLNNTISQTYTLNVTDGTPPSLVPNFTANPQANSVNITLAWDGASDNVAVGGYLLQRSTDNQSWQYIDGHHWNGSILGPSSTTYVDSNCEPLTKYYYRIRAYDTAESANMGDWTEANATTSDANPPVINHTLINYWPEDNDLQINATITDDAAVSSASLWYGSATQGTTIPMTFDGTNWKATIPGTEVQPTYIYYIISATDGTYWKSSRMYSTFINDTTPPSSVSASISLYTTNIGEQIPCIRWDNATDNTRVEYYVWAVQEQSFAQAPETYQQMAAQPSYYSYAEPETHYYFALAAVDEWENIGPWTYLDIETPAWDEEGPSITHNPPSSAKKGENLRIEAIITDQTGIYEAWLFYWADGGEGDWQRMQYSGGSLWRASIPFSAMEGDSINYYLLAMDLRAVESTLSNETSPFTIDLVGREVPASLVPASYTQNMTPGENMTVELNLTIGANSTWYFYLDMPEAEHSTLRLGNTSIPMDGVSPLFLQNGTYALNLTMQFPLEHNQTAAGILYVNQSDADNNVQAALTFTGEEGVVQEEKNWLPHVFLGAVVVLLVVGALMAKYLRPKRKWEE